MGKILNLIAGLICIAGGVYLLSLETEAGNTIFEGIAHGVGIYCIGKGLFVAHSGYAQGETMKAAQKLLNIASGRSVEPRAHDIGDPPPQPRMHN